MESRMSTTVTKNDILTEIQKALDSLPTSPGPRGITISEFARAKGIGREASADILGKLQAQGKVSIVRLKRENRFGQPYQPWGFQVVSSQK